MSAVQYIGLREHAGWRFTLAPEATVAGSLGYRLHQLQPSDASREWARREPQTPLCESVASKTAAIEDRPDEWREEAWLREWLRHGLIRAECRQ